MDYFEFLQKSVLDALILTLLQTGHIFGLISLTGLLLFFCAKWTRTCFAQAGASNVINHYTGWLGTPIHELGHAFFCLPFGIKIHEIKLFTPKSVDGSLGFIAHAPAKNFYQKIGLFFVSIGPIIFGTAVICLTTMLLPNQTAVFELIEKRGEISSAADFPETLRQMFSFGAAVLQTILSGANLKTPLFWLFAYITFSIASHMELSPSDLKGMGFGFVFITLSLYLLNIGSLLTRININFFLEAAVSWSVIFNGAFLYALSLSGVCFLLSWLILQVYLFVRWKMFLNPFGQA